MRVLVAEDEPQVAEAVARGLRREGMAVDVAGDGADALYKARLHRHDVVVLDRDLPLLHGDEVCRAISGELPGTKVLMLTGAAGVEELVDGLALGADDYMGKPFDFAELVARVRALGRRAGEARPAVLEAAGIVLDPARHTVQRNGGELELSPKEFGVLEILLGARGDTVSGEELLRAVWDEHADPFTNTVRMTMMKLRRKLGNPPVIETVTGAGYRI
jgi:two-component system, OmpR family, response regulator VanR